MAEIETKPLTEEKMRTLVTGLELRADSYERTAKGFRSIEAHRGAEKLRDMAQGIRWVLVGRTPISLKIDMGDHKNTEIFLAEPDASETKRDKELELLHNPEEYIDGVMQALKKPDEQKEEKNITEKSMIQNTDKIIEQVDELIRQTLRESILKTRQCSDLGEAMKILSTAQEDVLTLEGFRCGFLVAAGILRPEINLKHSLIVFDLEGRK